MGSVEFAHTQEDYACTHIKKMNNGALTQEINQAHILV